MFILSSSVHGFTYTDLDARNYTDRSAAIDALYGKVNNKAFAIKLYNYLTRNERILFYPIANAFNLDFSKATPVFGDTFNELTKVITKEIGTNTAYHLLLNVQVKNHNGATAWIAPVTALKEKDLAMINQTLRIYLIDNILKDL